MYGFLFYGNFQRVFLWALGIQDLVSEDAAKDVCGDSIQISISGAFAMLTGVSGLVSAKGPG